MRRKKKSRLAAAEFLAVLIVTAVVFTKGLARRSRGEDIRPSAASSCSCSYLLYIMRQSELSSISWRTS